MASYNLKLQRLIIISIIFSSMECIKDVSSSTLGQCRINSKLNKKNRDGKFPIFPLKEDTLVKSSFIYKAHEIIANGFQQWLILDEAELGIYLKYITSQSNNITYFDEYGQVNIALDRQMFNSIWEQFNETLCENYAVKQFKKDQLDLCKIAELLSHQPTVIQRDTIIKRIGAALRYEKCDKRNLEDWQRRNRDGQLPTRPTVIDLRRQSGAIAQAHETLRKSLKQFLDFQDRDLGTYLSYITNQRTEPFVDEYGQLITSYDNVFRSIWNQYNETQVQNYAVMQFENDKLDVCSVARFLSHQSAVDNRVDLMKRVGDALGDRCHPCTPYKRKELGGTHVLISNNNITIPDLVTPDESIEICKYFEKEIIEKNIEREGKTTVFWNCCKPACSWPGNGPSIPVYTCAANGETVIGSNDASGCDDGPSYSCNNHSPWAINSTLSYGFAALNGIPGEDILCCKCYHLFFTSSIVIGKSMIVQVTNTGTGFGESHFNLQIPGGGIGSNLKGCPNQWGLPVKSWGRQYGGVTGISQCDNLPAPLQDGCRWRFDWFNFADNPSVKFHEVDCPNELIQRTGCRV